MWKDPIVEEIRRIRLNIETECDNDFDKIFAQAIEAQEKLANRLVCKPTSNSQMNDTPSKLTFNTFKILIRFDAGLSASHFRTPHFPWLRDRLMSGSDDKISRGVENRLSWMNNQNRSEVMEFLFRKAMCESLQSIRKLRNNTPSQPLQLTAGSCGFNNVFGVVTGFGWSNVFRKTPAATELGSLGGRLQTAKVIGG